jgi:hypothetical protein
LGTVDLSNLEGTISNKDDEDLASDYNVIYVNEKPVHVHTFKRIEFVVKSSIVEFVEDLHPHKGIEDYGVEFRPGCLFRSLNCALNPFIKGRC